jgi:hypothetical protein
MVFMPAGKSEIHSWWRAPSFCVTVGIGWTAFHIEKKTPINAGVYLYFLSSSIHLKMKTSQD